MQDLLRMMLNRYHEKDFTPFELAPYNVAIKEARFFFPAPVCDWLQTLWDNDLKEFLEARLTPGTPRFLDVMKKLLKHLEEMPDRFGAELEFRQLTGRPSMRAEFPGAKKPG